jgi:hypothetical protein
MAQDPAVSRSGPVTGENAQVRTADSDRIDPHDHVIFVDDLRIRNLLPGLAPRTVVHEGPHDFLHWPLKLQDF